MPLYTNCKDGVWIPVDTRRLESLGYIKNKPLAFQALQRDVLDTAYSCLPNTFIRRSNAIDIGANVGLATEDMTNFFSHVTAFESDPAYLECFYRNLETTSGWQLYTMELGQKYSADFPVQPPMVDDFDLQNVSLFKCDVPENALVVIEGSTETIAINKPIVILNDFDAINYCQNRFGMIVLKEIEGYVILGWQKKE